SASAGGSEVVAQSSKACVAGMWQHACAVAASSTSRTVYLDGGNSGSNATSRVPTPPNRMNLGAVHSASTGTFGPLNGTVGNAALWNYALLVDQVERLYSPEWRFDLYHVLRKRTFSFAPAPAPAGWWQCSYPETAAGRPALVTY